MTTTSSTSGTTSQIDITQMTSAQQQAQAAAVAAANQKNGFSADGTSADSGDSLSGNFSFFLQMLTTQLTNQDPTQPMDTSQMSTQLAQFSSVQQQVDTNTKLDTLIANGTKGQQGTAVGYIGHEVESEGDTGNVFGGQGAFAYVLPSAAATATVTIKDASGNTVFSGSGTTDAGRNILVWDGVNSTTGAQEPDGTYTLSVSATDASGNAITADTRAVGIVSAVETDSSGNLVLDLAGGSGSTMNFSDVLAVREPSRVTSDTSDSSGDTTSGGTDTTTGGTSGS